MGSQWMDEDEFIKENYGLNEVEKISGSEVVHYVYNFIMIVEGG